MILMLMTLMILKHFVVDFLYQPEWMWRNKGTLGHYGGYAHASLHGMATSAILLMCGVPLEIAMCCSMIEAAAHYIIDYTKMNVVKNMGWGANTHGIDIDSLLAFLSEHTGKNRSIDVDNGEDYDGYPETILYVKESRLETDYEYVKRLDALVLKLRDTKKTKQDKIADLMKQIEGLEKE